MAIVILVDLALLWIVTAYALRSARHWPLWFAGFHAAGTALILIALIVPGPMHAIPERMAGFWSIPALFAMTYGLLKDRKAGIPLPV